MRRRVLVGLVLVATLTAGCGDSLEDRLDAAELRVRDLEDRYRDLRSFITTSTRPGAPPPTLGPPPTTAPGQVVTTVPTTGTTLPPELLIEPASAAAVRSVIGNAQWDEALPIPAACISTAEFTPDGPDGIGGGIISCDLPHAALDVAAFIRRINIDRDLVASQEGLRFTYGEIATIRIIDEGERSSFVAQQTYPFETTTIAIEN